MTNIAYYAYWNHTYCISICAGWGCLLRISRIFNYDCFRLKKNGKDSKGILPYRHGLQAYIDHLFWFLPFSTRSRLMRCLAKEMSDENRITKRDEIRAEHLMDRNPNHLRVGWKAWINLKENGPGKYFFLHILHILLHIICRICKIICKPEFQYAEYCKMYILHIWHTSGILALWIWVIIFVYSSIYKYMMVYTLYTCIYKYIQVYAKNMLYIHVYTSTCYQNIFHTGAQFHDVSVSTDTNVKQCMTYWTVWNEKTQYNRSVYRL